MMWNSYTSAAFALLLASHALHTSGALPQTQSPVDTVYQPPVMRYKQDKETFRVDFHRLVSRALQTSVGVEAMANNNEISLRRHLAVGDFAAFNNLLEGAIIQLPDVTMNEGKLTLKLKNPYCQDIEIGDIILRHSMESNQRFAFNVNIVGLSLDCYSKYDYDWRFLDGSGNIFAKTRDSSAETRLSFTSPNFSTSPPTNSNVDSCVSAVNIKDLDFSGGFVNSLLDTFEKSFRGAISNAVEDVLCDELSSLGTTFVGDLLDWAEEELDFYLRPVSPDRADPLHLERVLNVPPSLNLINFLNLEESLGFLVTDALTEVDSLFGEVVTDPNAPDGSGKDLGVNVLLRETVLDTNGALSIVVDDLPFAAFDPVLFKSHDLLTETEISLVSLRIFGLDTFTKFDPLVAIGVYTLQNAFHLDFITVELDLRVNIKPSTKEDSIIEMPNSNAEITESIQVQFGVDNLNVAAALLVAINEGRFKALEIGSILRSENLLSCFAAVVHELAISGFDVSIGSIRHPVLSGFVSTGIDRVVSSAIEAVFQMYEPVFLRALPSIFQTSFRDIVQEEILAGDLFNPVEGACTWLHQSSSLDEYIDFRDLLLLPSHAAVLGGSGKEPYGDIGRMVYNLFQDRIVKKSSEDGYLAINDIILKPVTKRQSGTEGMIKFPSDFVSISLNHTDPSTEFETMISGIDFSLGDLRINNLASVVPPIRFLDPTTKATTLWNDFLLSPKSEKTVDVQLSLRLKIDGVDSPWKMNDEIGFTISTDAMALTGELTALIETSKFLRLPLKHIFNPSCWLALIHAPEFGDDGHIVSDGTINLGLSSTYAYFSEIDIEAECVVCSKGMRLLPRMLDIFKTTGAVRVLGARLSEVTKTIMESGSVRTVIGRVLHEAPFSCPVSSKYDPNATFVDYPSLNFPGLSATDIDTILFATLLVAEIGLVAVAENHRLFSYQSSSPLVLQASLSSDLNYVDWGNFGTSLGLGTLGDELFKSGLEFIQGYDANGKLRINSLIDDSLLDDNGTLTARLGDTSFDIDGLILSLNEVKVGGLNNFLSVTLADPIGPQTISNEFVISGIVFEISASLDILSTEDPPQEVTLSLGVDDLAFSVALLAAFDVEQLGNLEFGSIVDTKNILTCLLSTAVRINVPSISVSSIKLRKPVVRGLIEETHNLLSMTLDQVYDEFQPNIEEALPIILDTSVRAILNSIVDNLVDGAECPRRDPGEADVDYRSMLSGVSRLYGNLPSLAMEFFRSRLLSLDASSGFAQLNRVIKTWTTNTYGTTGTLGFPYHLIDSTTRRFRRIGIEVFKFALGKFSVENVDSVEAPVILLEPNPENGTLLNNHVRLGLEPKPVRFTAEAMLESQGDPALTSQNSVEVVMDVVDVEIFAQVLAKLGVEEFLSFRLKQLLDTNCWLALFRTNDGTRDLLINNLAIAVSSFRMSFRCLSEGTCSNGLHEADLVLEYVTRKFGSDLGDVLMNVIEDIAESEYFHLMLDEWIEDAARACPEVTDVAPVVRRNQAPFLDLSLDTLRKITLLSVFLIEAGAVGVFDSHSSFSTDWDPLAAQENLLVNTTELIDFTNFSTSVGDWAETLVDELRSYAEGGEVGPRINEILRSFFLDDSGEMSFNLSHVGVSSPDFDLSLKEIRLKYLDTFENVTLLEMIGPQTIRNLINMDRVRGELDLTVRIGTENLPLTVHMEIENLDAAFSILLAVNKDVLGNIELRQLLFRENILRCVFSSMPEVVVTELDLSAARVVSFGVSGLGEYEQILEEITDVVLLKYGERVARLMKPFFGTTIRAVLNNWFGYMVRERFDDSCPVSSLSAKDGAFVDFRELLLSEADARSFGGFGTNEYGDLFRWVLEIVKENFLDIDEGTGLSDVNGAFIEPLTRAQSGEAGTISYPGNIFTTDTRVQVGGLDALVNLRLYDAYVRNLDTVGAPLSILEALVGKPFELSNMATFGTNEPVQVGFRFFISVSDSNSEIRNDLSVGVDLDSVRVALDAMMRLAEERFMKIPVKHLTDLNCWLYLMPAPTLDTRGISKEGKISSLGLTQLNASIGKVRLNITCNDCTSPGMHSLSNLLSTQNAADAATDVANRLFDYMTGLLGGEYLQARFDRMLNNAEHLCPLSPLYEPDFMIPEYAPFQSPRQESPLRALILLGISTGVIIFSVLSVMTCVKCIVRRRHRRWIRTLQGKKVQAILLLQTQESTKEAALNDLSLSLFRSPVVPWFVRWSMPVIILGNVGFFLSGHLSLGATVNIEAHLAQQEFSVKNFFEFSMLRSTLEIWEAGGKELAMMIFIFSVIWPYTKQLVTLVVWFSSPKVFSLSSRGSTLSWLDTLAKWSMVDIMTLIVTVAGFRISIQSPDVGFLPEKFYSLDLLVVPMWGLYANMIAQLISQLSSHAIIHYHRLVEETAVKEYEQMFRLHSVSTLKLEEEDAEDCSTLPSEVGPIMDSNQRKNSQAEKLSDHAFSRPHRGESDKLVTRRGTNSLAVVAAVMVASLAVVGCVLPSFSLEILGMLGVLVESGQEFQTAKTEYSVFTIVSLLFDQANFSGRFADYLGLGSLAGLLILSVLVVPIIQSLVLLYVWFTPMEYRRRARLAIAVEVLQAWQYTEVYLLSVVVASWQLGPVSDFMINTYCENLKEAFAEMVYYGILKEEDAQCFRVEARIEGASYFLAGASVALALLNTFVMRAVKQCFRDGDMSMKEFKAAPKRDGEEIEDVQVAIRRIKPVPVLFSDAFRWFLVREDSASSRQVFVVQNVRDQGISGITRNFEGEGLIKVRDLEPSPESQQYENYEEVSEFVEEDPEFSYFGNYISPVPRYGDNEAPLSEDTVISIEAKHDSASLSVGTSLEDFQEEPRTVLSAISELTEPQTQPWRDV